MSTIMGEAAYCGDAMPKQPIHAQTFSSIVLTSNLPVKGPIDAPTFSSIVLTSNFLTFFDRVWAVLMASKVLMSIYWSIYFIWYFLRKPSNYLACVGTYQYFASNSLLFCSKEKTSIMAPCKEEKRCLLGLIDVYRSLPALWKIKSKEYSDRQKKDNA